MKFPYFVAFSIKICLFLLGMSLFLLVESYKKPKNSIELSFEYEFEFEFESSQLRSSTSCLVYVPRAGFFEFIV